MDPYQREGKTMAYPIHVNGFDVLIGGITNLHINPAVWLTWEKVHADKPADMDWVGLGSYQSLVNLHSSPVLYSFQAHEDLFGLMCVHSATLYLTDNASKELLGKIKSVYVHWLSLITDLI